MASNTMWNGVRDFSEQNGVQHVDSLDSLSSDPEKSVMISVPYLDYQPDDLSRLDKFVSDGGTLIIMDDFGYGKT
jgi:hypothetical protein